MSFEAVRFSLNVPDLTPSERLVLIMLADRAGKTGHCFPSQKYLSLRTGLAIRTIRDALKGLEKKALVKRSKRHDQGVRTSDDYLIALPRPAAKSAGDQAADSAAVDRQNVSSIPTSPYGVGKGEEEEGTAKRFTLIDGGRS